jgi:peptidyl-prolyl cis-trans isomerase SurA
MRTRWSAPLVSFVLLLASTSSGAEPQETTLIVDRVVAIVGHDPILLSELRARAKPYLKKMDAVGPKSGLDRIEAEKQLEHELLARMVDDRLIAAEADRFAVTVPPAEIDAAIQEVAKDKGMKPAEVIAAMKDMGFSEEDYRAEIRRQILHEKMSSLRVRPRIKGLAKIAPADVPARVQAEWDKWLGELRAAHFIEVRL